MQMIKFLLLSYLLIHLSACSFGKKTINVKEVNKIKKVAVVMYTVPTSIQYKSDPRGDGKKSLLAIVSEVASANNGAEAAAVAQKNFIATLKSKKLPFRVLSQSDTLNNSAYSSLYKPMAAPAPAPKNAVMGFLSSMSGAEDTTQGAAPMKVSQFGLTVWNSNTALSGKSGEKQYIMDAIKALKVDAALVINDPGFSFVCEVCIAKSGTASTGSAFNATMINRAGTVVLNIREWFATTDAQAAMLAGAVNPGQHNALFEEHGKKTANVFVDAFKEAMAGK